MTLGDKLNQLRNLKDISHEKMGFELDISKTAIIKWEQNKSKPSIDNLIKICNYFETDVYSLLENVSNLTVYNTKFKGHSYVGYAQSFTVNNSTSPELIEIIQQNQNKISELIVHQNELLFKLLSKS